MTTEVKIANTNNKHAVLVKMMRGHAVAHEQIIAPGKEGAVLVYDGQTVTIEEVEAEHVEPVDEVSDLQPAPDAPAPAADAGSPEQAPTEAAPVDAPVAPAAPAKPAAKKKAATAK